GLRPSRDGRRRPGGVRRGLGRAGEPARRGRDRRPGGLGGAGPRLMGGRLDPVVGRARQLVRAALRDDPRPALVAVSGGADSLALAAVAAFGARAEARPARAVIVDHGLQPGSAAAAADAATTVEALGLPAEVIAVQVPAGRHGVEAAARSARYAALAD